MSKKSTIILIIAIIVIIAAVYLILRKQNEPVEVTPTATDIELNQAIEADTTVAINTSLDNIKVEDTSDADMKGIDSELKNL